MNYYKVGYTAVVGYNSINEIRLDGFDGDSEYFYKTNMYAYEKNGRIYDFMTNEEVYPFDMDNIEKGKLYYSALEKVEDLSEIFGIINLYKKDENWYELYKQRLETIRSEVAYLFYAKNTYPTFTRKRTVLEGIKSDQNREF